MQDTEFMHTWYNSAHSTADRITQLIQSGAWDLPFPNGHSAKSLQRPAPHTYELIFGNKISGNKTSSSSL